MTRSDPAGRGRTDHRNRILGGLLAAVASIGCGLASTGCGGSQESEPRADAEVTAVAPVEVETTAAAFGTIAERLSVPGTLSALRESHIGVEVGGPITEVFVREGDRVEEGQELFRIDAEPYELALRNARSGLDLARAERRQIESDLGRARDLRGQEIVSQQHVDRLETQLAVARARESQAGDAVRMAELDLRRTHVRAPYAGAVVRRLVDEGTTALRQPQTIVIVLQETHELEGRATIPEAHLGSVQVGDRAFVSVEGHAPRIETTIQSVSESVDPATRTYEVRMRIPNGDHRLKAGVFAEITIEPRPRTGVLLVPRDAIRTEEGRTRVLALRDGRAVALPVEIGTVSAGTAEVLSGLSAGDRLIVGEHAQTIAPGMAVRERAAPAGSPAPEPSPAS